MEKKRSVYLILVCVLILSFFTVSTGYGQEGVGSSFARQQALQLIEKLSPEEKVGQLFLITFDGVETNVDSEISKLISDFHIGGIVLKHSNGNITEFDSDINLRLLISGLQEIAEQTANSQAEGAEGIPDNEYIPLFIGVSQPGGSYPYDQILNGLTLLPAPMAIGATWDQSIAEEIGELLASELESLGFNLLLGPSMDVLDIKYSKDNNGLGVRTFGGDPYWVGEMGAAYIAGLHRGGGGRLAVIARNFPGQGGTDRLPGEEVSTVRKSLEQLKLVELPPFFKITDISGSIPASITNGLLTSHIRYQGFQGNIRATTKPISFDKNAIDLLMGIESLNTWRTEGGLLVSDDLGSQAVNKFFNPDGQYIDARQIAKNAFLAGNDVLFMGQMQSTGDADRFETYKNSIDLFVQKYKEDSAFSERVDDSVLKILTLKYDLYGEFALDRVIPDEIVFPTPLDFSNLPFETAKKAATLINPSQNQLDIFISEPPKFGERIVIFTDDQIVVPCEQCGAIEVFPVNGLQKSILKLYGPDGSGQISHNQIISYSFKDLNNYIQDPFNRPELEQNLSQADWVLFALREINLDEPSSAALRNLLSNNPVALHDKNVIVFSFDAPYYFDATEISAFSAYYALYSKLPAFIDVAARLVFQEINPIGASPVSIPGVGYELIENMSPHPDQVIPLSVDEDAAVLLQTEPQEENSPLPKTPVFKLGDLLPVKTGVILDHNGHPVPDGTVVAFTMYEQGGNITIQQTESETCEGIAKASISLQSAGVHEISVKSEPATNSEILVLDISEEEAIVSAIIPTPLPMIGGTAEVQENQPVIEEGMDIADIAPNNKLSEWFIATLFSCVFAMAVFAILRDFFILNDNLKISGVGMIGGLLNMVWFMFDLPGVNPRYGMNGYIRLCLVVLLGVAMGTLAGWVIIKTLSERLRN